MTLYLPQIDAAALAYGLDPMLVEAIVKVESRGEPFAFNPEPTYRWLWNVQTGKPFRELAPTESRAKYPPPDFPCLAGDPDQEWWGQQASWGLLQVMGAVARERGFIGKYLPELCDVETNLTVGCKHLRHLFQWSNGELEKTIGAYNAGFGGWDSAAGKRYRVKVLAALAEVRGL